MPTPTTSFIKVSAATLTGSTYHDASGDTISPQQYIVGTNHFRKQSQELRFASPADKPFRVIAGAFYQRQTNFIHQDYKVDNLAPDLSVNGFPGTLWLTQQKRAEGTMRYSAKQAGI